MIYHRHTAPTSRSLRPCDEVCGHVIQPGEQYARCDGVRDGEWFSWAQCASCRDWFDAFASLGADVLRLPDEARALFDIAADAPGEWWTQRAARK